MRKWILVLIVALFAFPLGAYAGAYITSADIVDGSIKRVDIGSGAIGTGQINGGAVTGAKIKDGSITKDDLAHDSVGSGKIQDDAITGGKIRDYAVLAVDINRNGLNADLLDGKDSAAFSLTSHDHDARYYTEAEMDKVLGDIISLIFALHPELYNYLSTGEPTEFKAKAQALQSILDK